MGILPQRFFRFLEANPIRAGRFCQSVAPPSMGTKIAPDVISPVATDAQVA
jgi:hypothetical protein